MKYLTIIPILFTLSCAAPKYEVEVHTNVKMHGSFGKRLTERTYIITYQDTTINVSLDNADGERGAEAALLRPGTLHLRLYKQQRGLSAITSPGRRLLQEAHSNTPAEVIQVWSR